VYILTKKILKETNFVPTTMIMHYYRVHVILCDFKLFRFI